MFWGGFACKIKQLQKGENETLAKCKSLVKNLSFANQLTNIVTRGMKKKTLNEKGQTSSNTSIIKEVYVRKKKIIVVEEEVP